MALRCDNPKNDASSLAVVSDLDTGAFDLTLDLRLWLLLLPSDFVDLSDR